MTEPTQDVPDDEETGEFMVRFAMRVKAKGARDAAPTLLDIFMEKGFRDWVYRVEDPETGALHGYFDGYGDLLDIDAVVAAARAAKDGAVTDNEAVDDEAVDDEDDAALLALAAADSPAK